jgi:tRNA A37 threonylcarbamoyladenosine dehydratase
MTVNPLFQRLGILTGGPALDALGKTSVLVFGAGGVGSWCAEALVRSGIGSLGIIDSDRVCVTNVNRQVQATAATVGRMKVEALKERLQEIHPQCVIRSFGRVFCRDAAGEFGLESADYVIDAIDSLGPKLDLIEYAAAAGKPLFASMGMAQKLDPAQLKTAGIWETAGCPLARLVRSGLRKRGFKGRFTVVYSAERLPLHRELNGACGAPRCLCPPGDGPEWCRSKKRINGSAVTVTAAAGMILAGLVIRDVYARFDHG